MRAIVKAISLSLCQHMTFPILFSPSALLERGKEGETEWKSVGWTKLTQHKQLKFLWVFWYAKMIGHLQNVP